MVTYQHGDRLWPRAWMGVRYGSRWTSTVFGKNTWDQSRHRGGDAAGPGDRRGSTVQGLACKTLAKRFDGRRWRNAPLPKNAVGTVSAR